jgi:hypothetical protein
VHVCRPLRAGDTNRLSSLAQHGYCAALKEYFYGVREHLIFTPGGMLAGNLHLPGNRHDVHGAYMLLKTQFTGVFYADNAYTPNAKKRDELLAHGIRMCAVPKANAKLPLAPCLDEYLRKKRGVIERFIGLFDQQFHAARTLNRSVRHYLARRAFKLLSHNCSRVANAKLERSIHSVAHFHAAA